MATVQPPAFLEASTYNAIHLRRTFGSLLRGPGVGGTDHLRVTASAPVGMSVLVGPGSAWMPTTGSTGLYYGYNDANLSVAIATADPSNARIDLVYAAVNDAAAVGSGSNDWYITTLKGTAAATPLAPTLPARAIALAHVRVPAGATAIDSALITSVRTMTGPIGGIVTITNGAYPSSPFLGQEVYESDKGQMRYWKGNRWAISSMEFSRAVHVENPNEYAHGFTDGYLFGFDAPGTGNSISEDTDMYSVVPGTGVAKADAGYIEVKEAGKYRVQAAVATDSPGIGYYVSLSLVLDGTLPTLLEQKRFGWADSRQAATGGFLDIVREEEVFLPAGARIKARVVMNSSEGVIRKSHLYVARLAG